MSEVIRDIVTNLAAAASPGALMVVGRSGERQVLTWPDLAAHVRRRAADLRTAGVMAGDRVALMMQNDMVSMANFLALAWLGATPLSLKPGRDTDLNMALVDALAARYGVHKALDVPGVAGREDIRTVSYGRLPEDDLAFVQFTSGTTFDPKPVPVSDAMLAANFAAMLHYNRFEPQRIAMNFLPLSHDFGLVAAFLLGLHQRHTTVMLDPMFFYANPHRYLPLIAEHGVTSIALTNTSLDYLTRQLARRPVQSDLSRLSSVTLGAEPIEARTVRAFHDLLRPNGLAENAFSFGYGMAESVLFVTGHRVESLDTAFVGHPVHPGRQLAKLGPATFGIQTRLEDGRIALRGASVFPGYWGAEPRGDAWYRSNDRAVWVDGELAVLGRADDCIIRNGRNLYLNEMEAVLSDVCPDEQIVVVGGDDIVVLVVRTAADTLEPALVGRLQDVLVRRFETRAAAIRPVHRKHLAFSSSGKINRPRTFERIAGVQ